MRTWISEGTSHARGPQLQAKPATKRPTDKVRACLEARQGRCRALYSERKRETVLAAVLPYSRQGKSNVGSNEAHSPKP